MGPHGLVISNPVPDDRIEDSPSNIFAEWSSGSEWESLPDSFLGIRPWWLILLGRLGLSWTWNVLAVYCWFYVQIVFSSSESSVGVGLVSSGTWLWLQAENSVSRTEPSPEPSTHWTLISALILIMTLLPLTLFTLFRMWLLALDICVCWSLFLCLQSCWFPVREHGLAKKFWFVYQQSMN